MPTVFTHSLVAPAIWPWLRSRRLPGVVLALGALCAVVPDLDVIGLRLGVPYGSLFGHRGFSHSLPFAAALALVLVGGLRLRRAPPPALPCFLFLFACTASHGLLDAMTTGGYGIAFFAPFSNERFFLPWRPIEVSPLSLDRFLDGRGIRVLASELVWVVVPLTATALAGWLVRRRWIRAPVRQEE